MSAPSAPATTCAPPTPVGERSSPSTCRRPVKVEGVPCYQHGGRGAQVQRKATDHAVESDLAQLLERYDAGPVTNPLEALLSLAGEVLAWKNLLGDRVARLQSKEWRWEGRLAEQTRAEVTLYERSMDRAGSLLVSIARLDLNDRVAQMNKRVSDLQAMTLFAALAAVLDNLGLGEVVVTHAKEMIAMEIATRNGDELANHTQTLPTPRDELSATEPHGQP